MNLKNNKLHTIYLCAVMMALTWLLTPATSFAAVGSLTKTDTIVGGAVSRVALPKNRNDGWTVVAMVDGDGRLRVKSYAITGGGEITPVDTEVDFDHIETARDVVIELVSDGSSEDFYVTATRDGDDELHLTAWRLDALGNLTQTAHAKLGAVSEMALAAPWRRTGGVCGFFTRIFVVAVRDGQNRLRLISWELNTAFGQLIRQDTFISSGRMFPPQPLGQTEIRDIAALTTLPGQLVAPGGDAVMVTAFKDEDADLRLYSWFVTCTGNISFSDLWEASEVRDIAAFGFPDGLVTAVRDGNDKLRLISWTVSNTGAIQRQSTQPTAWSLTEVAGAMVIGYDLGPVVLNIAVRMFGNLWVTSWTIDAGPPYAFNLVDIDLRGPATDINLASPHNTVGLVALESGDNTLLLTTYKTAEF